MKNIKSHYTAKTLIYVYTFTYIFSRYIFHFNSLQMTSIRNISHFSHFHCCHSVCERNSKFTENILSYIQMRVHKPIYQKRELWIGYSRRKCIEFGIWCKSCIINDHKQLICINCVYIYKPYRGSNAIQMQRNMYVCDFTENVLRSLQLHQ